MSAMLRAHKSGGPRRVRSLSLESGSSGGSEPAGARLSNVSTADSPPHVHFSSVTQEFGRLGFASAGALRGDDADDEEEEYEKRRPFQLGKKPSDVFTASPQKSLTATAPAMTSHSYLSGNATGFKPSYLGKDADEEPSYLGKGGDEEPSYFAKSAAEYAAERRIKRSVTTGSVMVASPDNRASGSTAKAGRSGMIGGVDVQGIYPATACVFVANLPEYKEDRAIEAAVTREFSRYGTVFVKIRRDGNRMPFAFCQYTSDDDANNALQQGRGAMILGRPCRTERVRANRSFVIYNRRPGEDITVAEARALLEQYGELSKCEVLGAEEQEALGIPKAILVEFATFDPKRDIIHAVRGKDKYRIDVYDTRRKARSDSDEEFLRKYDADRRSVFVGGLPYDVEKSDILELFSEVGDVVDIDLVKRTNNDGTPCRPFAFVEFTRADVPDTAIRMVNGTRMGQYFLKVERKVFKRSAGEPRRSRSQAFAMRSSVTPKTPKVYGGAGGAAGSSGNRFGGAGGASGSGGNRFGGAGGAAGSSGYRQASTPARPPRAATRFGDAVLSTPSVAPVPESPRRLVQHGIPGVPDPASPNTLLNLWPLQRPLPNPHNWPVGVSGIPADPELLARPWPPMPSVSPVAPRPSAANTEQRFTSYAASPARYSPPRNVQAPAHISDLSYLGPWPGMMTFQDPITGLTCYSYHQVEPSSGVPLTTPTRDRDNRADDQQHTFHDA